MIGQLKEDINRQNDIRFKALYSLMLNVLTASDGYASGNVSDSDTHENLWEKTLNREVLSDIENRFPLYTNAAAERFAICPRGPRTKPDAARNRSTRIGAGHFKRRMW